MRRTGILLAALFVLAASGCAPQVDVEAEAAAIRETTDVEWLEAGQAKDLDRFVSFYTDDASLFLPNAPIVTGKEAIRSGMSQAFSTPSFAISWQTTNIEVSRTGDLAYSYGTYEETANDPEGNPVSERGKWVAIWEKQPDGSWKVVIEILNSDGPAASE